MGLRDAPRGCTAFGDGTWRNRKRSTLRAAGHEIVGVALQRLAIRGKTLDSRSVGTELCVMQARQDPEHSVLALMHEPPDRSPMMVAADRSPASGSGSRFEPTDPSLIYFLAVPSGLTGLVPLGPMPLICTMTSSSFAPS